ILFPSSIFQLLQNLADLLSSLAGADEKGIAGFHHDRVLNRIAFGHLSPTCWVGRQQYRPPVFPPDPGSLPGVPQMSLQSAGPERAGCSKREPDPSRRGKGRGPRPRPRWNTPCERTPLPVLPAQIF